MGARDPKKQQAGKVVRALHRDYAAAECALDYASPLQLLVATILSAQCTDVRVNKVTPALFEAFPKAGDFAAARLSKIEKLIQSTGFFRNKAKHIKACCQRLVALHAGRVPDDLDSLVALPGVGRKTANVVLGVAFDIASGVVVDTHVGRISRRLGLTDHTNAVQAERDLMQLLPKREWISFSHRMIHHGRQVCKARKPDCESCRMSTFCPRVGVAN